MTKNEALAQLKSLIAAALTQAKRNKMKMRVAILRNSGASYQDIVVSPYLYK